MPTDDFSNKINEMQSVLASPNSTVKDIEKYFPVGYEIIGKLSSGNGENGDKETIEQVSQLLQKMNDRVKELKEKQNEVSENPYSDDAPEAKEDNSAPKVEKPSNQNILDQIAEEVKAETGGIVVPPSIPVKAETKVTSVVSENDPKDEDLRLESHLPPKKKEAIKEEKPPIVQESPVKDDVPAPQLPEKKEEAPLEIEDNIEKAEQVIVSNSNAKDAVVEDPHTAKISEQLEEIYTPKPIEDDDDEGNLNIDEIEIEEAPKKGGEDTSAFETIDSNKNMYGIKSVSRKATNELLKALSSVNISSDKIKGINFFDSDSNDEEIRMSYLKAHNSLVASPRTARTALLMSGHYEEISSYGNWDMASIARKISNPDQDFVDTEMMMYQSIYEHVQYVSYAKSKPDFNTWAQNIKYPDKNSLFFGVYDANSVGANNYSLDCPYCGQPVTASIENRDLAVAIPKELDKNYLDSFITNRNIMQLSDPHNALSTWASTTKIRKQLPNSKIIVEYTVPSIYDYLTTISTARAISNRDMGAEFKIDAVDDISNPNTQDDALRVLIYMYVSRLGIPSKEGNRIKYIGTRNKAEIIEFINALDVTDYASLFAGDEIIDLISKRSTDYYLEDVECVNPDCKKKIKHVAFDPKLTFFFKIGEVRTKLTTA